ncbi:MAG TPA: hypothetical protein VFE58_13460 [Tepidisphaeraceae bacterium]|jgi:hypothetical protein|nr:hypothetical protein [Tepidisphaeraceae bacterium]
MKRVVRPLIYRLQQSLQRRRQQRKVQQALRRRQPADPIFIFGLSRSGSTWLQDTIGAWHGTVSLFEPIHKKNPETIGAFTLEDWRPGQQMSADERRVLDSILRGEILTKRILPAGPMPDEINRFCIKLIHCNNGMPRMVHDLRPRYRPLIILRHPCAHVASWKRLKWTENFGGLAGRYNGLLAAHPHLREPVSGLSTPLDWMVGSWCLGNYVPLAIKPANRWTVVRYESLLAEPERILGEIFATWGEAAIPAEVLGAVGRVSRTTWRKGQPAGAVATANSWQEEISLEESRQVFEICRRFGVEVDAGGYMMKSGGIG